ncbi:DnaJ family molecular chaperone [Thermoactinomyces sp. DSM 45892]|uniref:J domain-containing protein n=1 Tax=Thermoactinomyces sp. DSM 45892 TaxID=1882753 RepID=UPI00089CC835|nr:J domain-containing protein [Thermoactinomyces sp. DSM 45892]SDY86026.1 hypothetical protein SAMN05444416_10996 [Thermoactinomyces sp. DSM 45892]
MTNYFYFSTPVSSLMELRKQYRMLAMKNHPDKGGSEEAMATVNNEYEELKKNLGRHEADQPKESQYQRSEEEEQEIDEKLRAIIMDLIHLPIEIEIIGEWIWIDDELAKPFTDELIRLGFRLSKKQGRWYWSPTPYKKRRGSLSMEKKRKKFGSTTVKGREPKTLN